MPKKDAIFLSPQEAVAAVRRDFGQYPPQTALFCELYPLLIKDDTRARKDPHGEGIWISRAGTRTPSLAEPEKVGGALVRALEKADADLDLLARVCTRVFRAGARVQAIGQETGIQVETGLERFSCRLCGRCCRDLDYSRQCTVADAALWEEAGRSDIKAWAAPIRQKDAVVGYTIWVYPGTRKFADTCPWLIRGHQPDQWVCSIHPIKPSICRQYPGTRKHARMTGCPGIG